MSENIITQIGACANTIRLRACTGCRLVDVADDLDDVAGQLRWEFDELLTA